MTTHMFTRKAVEQWLVDYLSRIVGIAPQQIDLQKTFTEYGLESGTMMGFTADLEQWLNVELSTAVLFENPTTEALAAYLDSNYDSLAQL